MAQGHIVRVIVQLGRDIWRTDDLERFEQVVDLRMDRGPLRTAESGLRRIQRELRLPYAALFESKRFAEACVRELQGFDLLYERSSWVSYGGALAKRSLGIPFVLENNGDHLADLTAKGIAPTGAQRRLSLALMRRVVESADHVVVSGDGWRDSFLKRWGIRGDRVTTVENGTVLVRLLSRPELRSFGPSNEYPITLAYLGGFQPWQGVSVLLHALASDAVAATGARLVLIGGGAGTSDARLLAQELGVTDRTAFTGALRAEEYAPLLAQADLGVAPYCGWPEYSGLKLFDYKAAGLAIVASGENGRPRTLTHGQTGWIVPPCDEETLAAAIVQLVRDPALRRRLGQTARREAEDCHGWDVTARRLEAIFQELV
jgi:glycosyltransferase involved in cell wall biosynthesis